MELCYMSKISNLLSWSLLWYKKGGLHDIDFNVDVKDAHFDVQGSVPRDGYDSQMNV